MVYWRWERDEYCLAEWGKNHTYEEIMAVVDAIDRATHNNPDDWPGVEAPGGPSATHREMTVGSVTIRFVVCDPIDILAHAVLHRPMAVPAP